MIGIHLDHIAVRMNLHPVYLMMTSAVSQSHVSIEWFNIPLFGRYIS